MNSLKNKGKNEPVILMVLGAGARGPLVDCCIRAAETTGSLVEILALEKNPHAFKT